ncbi:MAG: carbon monoxide dehydrogenase subunit G [Solirubrobacteraceae bacterium]|nr:carbon monoxide dehydrogenase subunit G [Solirubrobacteraceae bacterium]
MRVEQTQVFPDAREVVWERLLDFGVLERTLPGIEELERLDDDTLKLRVRVTVPAVTGAYEGTVRVAERIPVDRYTLSGDAKGRLGWLRGDADFTLVDNPEGTAVTAVMDFRTGGALSGVGQRLMQAIAKGMVRDYFVAFQRELPSGQGAPEMVSRPRRGIWQRIRAWLRRLVAREKTTN